MVSSTTAVGGTRRCVTLAAKDTLALEKWMTFLEKVGKTAVKRNCIALTRKCTAFGYHSRCRCCCVK